MLTMRAATCAPSRSSISAIAARSIAIWRATRATPKPRTICSRKSGAKSSRAARVTNPARSSARFCTASRTTVSSIITAAARCAPKAARSMRTGRWQRPRPPPSGRMRGRSGRRRWRVTAWRSKPCRPSSATYFCCTRSPACRSRRSAHHRRGHGNGEEPLALRRGQVAQGAGKRRRGAHAAVRGAAGAGNMSELEHEKEFEAYLARRPRMRGRFAESDNLEPPRELDRIVLAKAREAIRNAASIAAICACALGPARSAGRDAGVVLRHHAASWRAVATGTRREHTGQRTNHDRYRAACRGGDGFPGRERKLDFSRRAAQPAGTGADEERAEQEGARAASHCRSRSGSRCTSACCAARRYCRNCNGRA